ncbi:MAG: Rap1a/Tai family immunity protein [Alphaproteobacteria bacterium]
MRKAFLTLACFAALAAQPASASQFTTDDFVVTKAEDLVDVCSVGPDDPNYTAAANFCQGYTLGAWQYYQALMEKPGHKPFVCVPEPAPTRNQLVAEFVAWGKAHPEYATSHATDTMFKFLTEKMPCHPETKKKVKK